MSKIAVQCSGCGRRYAAPESRAGSSLNCHSCATPIPIPAPPLPQHTAAGLLGEARSAAYYSEAGPAVHMAGSQALEPLVKVAIGVGVAAVCGLLIAIAVHSWGGSGDSPEVAEIPVHEQTPAAPRGESAEPVVRSPRGASAKPASKPVKVIDRAYYENNGWVQKTGIGGKFSQWFPASVTTQTQTVRGAQVVRLTARQNPSEACQMLAIIQGRTMRDTPRQAIEKQLSQQLPAGARIISKDWKQEGGMELLDVIATNDNTDLNVYTRFFMDRNWMVILTWQARRSGSIDEQKLHKFLSGFEVTGG